MTWSASNRKLDEWTFLVSYMDHCGEFLSPEAGFDLRVCHGKKREKIFRDSKKN